MPDGYRPDFAVLQRVAEPLGQGDRDHARKFWQKTVSPAQAIDKTRMLRSLNGPGGGKSCGDRCCSSVPELSGLFYGNEISLDIIR
jgi:hypothetical protein